MSTLIVDKSPSDEFSLHNQAVVCRKTADYAQVTVPGVVQECYLTLKDHSAMQAGKLGLSGLQVYISISLVPVWKCCIDGVLLWCRENG